MYPVAGLTTLAILIAKHIIFFRAMHLSCYDSSVYFEYMKYTQLVIFFTSLPIAILITDIMIAPLKQYIIKIIPDHLHSLNKTHNIAHFISLTSTIVLLALILIVFLYAIYTVLFDNPCNFIN